MHFVSFLEDSDVGGHHDTNIELFQMTESKERLNVIHQLLIFLILVPRAQNELKMRFRRTETAKLRPYQMSRTPF